MTESPDIAPENPDIPEDFPPPEDGGPELPDQPLGPPSEIEKEDAPLPGVPEAEPPASG